MLGILDYGVGNLFSIRSSLAALGVDSVVTADQSALSACSALILPGVGAFEKAAQMEFLERNGDSWDDDSYEKAEEDTWIRDNFARKQDESWERDDWATR